MLGICVRRGAAPHMSLRLKQAAGIRRPYEARMAATWRLLRTSPAAVKRSVAFVMKGRSRRHGGHAAHRVECVGHRPITAGQSPGRACRNSRADGYHGQSSRSSNQRQSGTRGSSIQTGRPSAPARCATDVSTLITRSSVSTSAAVSAKSVSVSANDSTLEANASASRAHLRLHAHERRVVRCNKRQERGKRYRTVFVVRVARVARPYGRLANGRMAKSHRDAVPTRRRASARRYGVGRHRIGRRAECIRQAHQRTLQVECRHRLPLRDDPGHATQRAEQFTERGRRLHDHRCARIVREIRVAAAELQRVAITLLPSAACARQAVRHRSTAAGPRDAGAASHRPPPSASCCRHPMSKSPIGSRQNASERRAAPWFGSRRHAWRSRPAPRRRHQDAGARARVNNACAVSPARPRGGMARERIVVAAELLQRARG